MANILQIKIQNQKALDAIAVQIGKCKICKKDKIGLAVPGEGNPSAKIVFIGEAPGKTESKTGRPFVGRSGKLLRSLISDAGINEKDFYITSPVKYLPKHGTPTEKEIAHGKVHLLKQLDIIKPKIIVLLGNTAAKALLQSELKISEAHGTAFTQDKIKYFVSYHPAAALHLPKLRAILASDFKKLKRFIKA